MRPFAKLTSNIISNNARRSALSASRTFSSKIAVKNLPFTVTPDRLKLLLNELELEAPDAKIDVPLTANGKAKGWAILEFDDKATADLAIEAITGHELQGRVLKANLRGETMVPVVKDLDSPSSQEEVDYFTDLRIQLLKDSSREKEDMHLQSILDDEDKTGDDYEFEIESSKKEKQKKLKAKADLIRYKDETQEEKMARVRAEAQEEEYQARCKEASKALVRPEGEASEDIAGEWIETVVSVDRVQKIIKGGSIMSYRVLVVVGNANGAGGFGIGKAADPASATTRAIREAKKNIIVVDRYKNTALVHSVEGRHNSCRVVLRAVPPGKGTKAGKVVGTILEQMGIADCTGKAVGRRQPYAVVRATFKALARHTSIAEISRARGRRLLDMQWRSGKQ